ncbi:hypothetical protein O181_075879 [Austropuccinia psidii MF-1]|uniref:Integrase catalytic domain-containing protein n=1 Tax=Austropuccinia psidii MF-1 TaxID=1389203 RepID=A0A9Q3FBV1_9BASI|nr:hypothetical protein [Austropuccinia psidii MF-1]
MKIELPHMYLKIRNCLLIPQLSVNLLSLNSFIDANYTVKKASNPKCFKVLNTEGNLVLNGSYESGNFVIFQQKPNAYNVTLPSTKIIALHQAYGNPSIGYFKKMSQNPKITPFNCSTCDISKMTKTPFSGTFPIPSRKLEYFLRIVNGFFHYVWIYFLKNKSESKDIIKNHINKIERQANLLVGNIVSDNGSEFKNDDLSSFLVQKGISHLTSAPYTPEKNPFAEHGNQTTVNKERCILKDSGLDLSCWAEPDTNNDSFTVSGKLIIPPPNNPGLRTTNGSPLINNEIEELPTELSCPTELSMMNEVPNFSSAKTFPNPPKQVKGYIWSNEPIDKSKEVIGDVGDPGNICNEPRRKKHTANFSEILHNNPKNYKQAMSNEDSDHWKQAISQELSNMDKHNVWSPISNKKEIKALTTTWVFKKKTNENGNLTKYKARLCVRRFNQREGIDYDNVFSPTGCLTSLRLLLTLCHLHQFKIEQMDVGCAFLNGIPDETLYIYCPEGYKTQNSNILKLNKSIYGLKQSPCCWQNALKSCLDKIGLTPCYTDPCLFYSKNPDKPIWLYVHVDDLIFGGSWNTEFKEKINKSFNMEDLGTVKYVLGIRITQETNCVTLIQDKLIDQILTEFKMINCRPSSSPLPSNIKDLKNNPELPCTKPPFSYRQAIGSLQYLVQCTCPNLAFSVSFISQFLEAPTESHFNTLDHVFKYLVGTKEYSLKLGQNGIQHNSVLQC